MKVGIVGVGAVGTACAKALLLRGSCRELVLIDKDHALAKGVATDLTHGEPLCQPMRLTAGTYRDLKDAQVVAITAGWNEKKGGATNRQDPRGRMILLEPNAKVYREIVPQVAKVAPRAVIVVVTDPPDPLADVTRTCTQTNPVLSTGTFLDSLRFRIQIASRLECDAGSVEATVLGEHGVTQVYVWSLARIGSEPIRDIVARRGLDWAQFKSEVEQAVKFANIDIIEGTGASQHGIGIVTARITEAILNDERLVVPIGAYQPDYGVTFSLPAAISSSGVRPQDVFHPPLDENESEHLRASADFIKRELAGIPD